MFYEGSDHYLVPGMCVTVLISILRIFLDFANSEIINPYKAILLLRLHSLGDDLNLGKRVLHIFTKLRPRDPHRYKKVITILFPQD